ncbi:hypothetical protein Goshw_005453, partial [Gossypium schwendimanii]|nr:hypothetical protein [Gossypium schwendimanii]
CGSRAAIGGVARGPSSDWLFGFKVSVSFIDIFQIEAKVVFEGLRLAWNKGFRQVELESGNALLIGRLAKMTSSDIEHLWFLRSRRMKSRSY